MRNKSNLKKSRHEKKVDLYSIPHVDEVIFRDEWGGGSSHLNTQITPEDIELEKKLQLERKSKIERDDWIHYHNPINVIKRFLGIKV